MIGSRGQNGMIMKDEVAKRMKGIVKECKQKEKLLKLLLIPLIYFH